MRHQCTIEYLRSAIAPLLYFWFSRLTNFAAILGLASSSIMPFGCCFGSISYSLPRYMLKWKGPIDNKSNINFFILLLLWKTNSVIKQQYDVMRNIKVRSSSTSTVPMPSWTTLARFLPSNFIKRSRDHRDRTSLASRFLRWQWIWSLDIDSRCILFLLWWCHRLRCRWLLSCPIRISYLSSTWILGIGHKANPNSSIVHSWYWWLRWIAWVFSIPVSLFTLLLRNSVETLLKAPCRRYHDWRSGKLNWGSWLCWWLNWLLCFLISSCWGSNISAVRWDPQRTVQCHDAKPFFQPHPVLRGTIDRLTLKSI